MASRAVLSPRRRAARPVGAASWISIAVSLRPARIASTSVVLPVPGPPVMIRSLLVSAMRSASRWPRASSSASARSTASTRASGSSISQGGRAAARRRRLSAIARSAWWITGRNRQGSPSIGVEDQRAGRDLGDDRLLDRGRVDAEQLGRAREQLALRQRAVAFALRLLEDVGGAGAQAERANPAAMPRRAASWSAEVKPMPRISSASR